MISVIAGKGVDSYDHVVDGVATSTALSSPVAVAVDSLGITTLICHNQISSPTYLNAIGNVFIADSSTYIRKITSGQIETIYNVGASGYAQSLAIYEGTFLVSVEAYS